MNVKLSSVKLDRVWSSLVWSIRDPEEGEIAMSNRKQTVLVFRDCIFSAFERYLLQTGMPKSEIYSETKIFTKFLAEEIVKSKFEEK